LAALIWRFDFGRRREILVAKGERPLLGKPQPLGREVVAKESGNAKQVLKRQRAEILALGITDSALYQPIGNAGPVAKLLDAVVSTAANIEANRLADGLSCCGAGNEGRNVRGRNRTHWSTFRT
jgi:hypothetical protein